MQASGGVFKILSIDGGGIRRMIPAALLAELKGAQGAAALSFFDLVAGTSTGGILALGLTVPKSAAAPLYTAGQLLEMYEREGPRILPVRPGTGSSAGGNLTREKYPHEGIESVLWNTSATRG